MDWYTCITLFTVFNVTRSANVESALWTKKLASSAITAFDVFRPSFEEPSMFKEPPSLVLIRQPPSPFFQKTVEGITTFLNTTKEGAWYALSTDRYPLLTSRAQPAPWVIGADETRSRNLTKEDLVGVHPIARTLEIKVDNLGLPAPNMPKLIDGGDWQNSPQRQMNSITENSLLLLVALVIFLLVIWKRQVLTHVDMRRRTLAAKDIVQSHMNVISDDKLPVSNEHADDRGSSQITADAQVQEINDNNPALEKKPRRKRGQRGGKNNKRRVEFVEPTTDGDEEKRDDNEADPLPRDLPLNDQGNHTIDGLTVTDKLLGIFSRHNFNNLGSGSQGTFVYEGIWDGRKVAVKRMQIENFEIADKEVNHLLESDEHPNIVRYHTNKRSDKFIYIALELCPATLEQVIVHGNKEPYCHLAGPNLRKQYALSQIASGLQFLHSLKIVHRDLKPQNILVAPPKLRDASPTSPLWRHYKPDQTRCLISDFGLCKKLEPDHSTFQAQSTMAAGTSGWRAPEVLRGVENEKRGLREVSSLASDTVTVSGPEGRITRAVDIFSMGCLFYYVLTDGEHPFGSLTYLRDGRIMDSQSDLSALDCSTNDGVEAKDLISRMIAPNAADRYSFSHHI
jgi:serine/threonine-protein kinase/endoribonuclease IRE1